MIRRRLELIRWALILLMIAAVVGMWAEPKGGWALLLFFAFTVTGIPAAMLSLHLHPPKWFTELEERRKRN